MPIPTAPTILAPPLIPFPIKFPATALAYPGALEVYFPPVNALFILLPITFAADPNLPTLLCASAFGAEAFGLFLLPKPPVVPLEGTCPLLEPPPEFGLTPELAGAPPAFGFIFLILWFFGSLPSFPPPGFGPCHPGPIPASLFKPPIAIPAPSAPPSAPAAAPEEAFSNPSIFLKYFSAVIIYAYIAIAYIRFFWNNCPAAYINIVYNNKCIGCINTPNK